MSRLEPNEYVNDRYKAIEDRLAVRLPFVAPSARLIVRPFLTRALL